VHPFAGEEEEEVRVASTESRAPLCRGGGGIRVASDETSYSYIILGVGKSS